jgi:hypothetical protein
MLGAGLLVASRWRPRFSARSGTDVARLASPSAMALRSSLPVPVVVRSRSQASVLGARTLSSPR